MSQYKASLRKALRSAMANKKAADNIIDALAEAQANFNSAMDKLEADGVKEITSVTAVADVAGSLNNTYFTFSDALDTHKYYVWYNINSAGVDPAVAGRTGIMVAAATGASANTIGGATRTAIAAAAANSVAISGSNANITITNNSTGIATDAADGTAATGFTILVTQQGANANALLDTNFAATLALVKLLSPDAAIHNEANESSERRVLRSVLGHKKCADSVVDSIVALQSSINGLMTKLDAQAGTLSSTNFAATLAVSVVDFDAAGSLPAQDKASFRKILRAKLSQKRLADLVADGIHGLQASVNSATAALDAGHINSYMAPLKVSAISPDSNS